MTTAAAYRSTPAGELNQRITFQQRDPAINELREQSKGWVDYADAWAKVLPLRVRDRFSADQNHAEIDTVFRVRWRKDITNLMRIVWNDQPYDIQGFPKNVKGQNEFIDIECTSGVRDGR